MTVVLYALGGGFGHAVRACSLARALERRGSRAVVLLPEGKVTVAEAVGARCHPLARRSSASALRADVDAALSALSPSHLIVDALPAGVLRELTPLPDVPRRTLLLRLHTRLAASDTRGFHDVIDLEAHLDWRPGGIAAESFPPVTAAAATTTGTLPSADVALLPGGDPRLASFLKRLADSLRRRDLRVAVDDGCPAPPSQWVSSGPRVVVGAAGYNLVYETLAHGVWHVAIPRPRAFDDQRRRASAVAEVASSPHDVERRVLQHLERAQPRPLVVETAGFESLAARLAS